MLISQAWAQGAGGGGGDFLVQLFPLILIFVVFYFLLIRPQQKKMKQHKEMLGSIRRGDKIVTGGGIVGTVTKVIDDNEVQLEIAEGVRVRVQRHLISSVLAKVEPGTPAKTEPQDSAAPAAEPAEQEGIGGKLKKMLGGKST